MNSKFNPHGDFSLVLEGDLLVVHAFGAWNIEASIEFKQHAQSTITEAFNGEDFYVLICAREWLPTHDSLAVLNELTLWARENGMRGEALCIQGKLASEVIVKQIIPAETEHYQYKSFNKEQLARDWLSYLKAG